MPLKTLSGALSLLERFTPDRQAWGVRELAKECDMHHAVVHRMLLTLAHRGFLVQDRHSQKYMLGLRFMELGWQVQARLHLKDVIKPAMTELAEKVGETVFLTLLENKQGVCLEIAECPGMAVKYSVTVGTRCPLTLGANAKVILACLPPVEQQAVLALSGPPPGLSLSEYMRQLVLIREQGFCCTLEEYTQGTFGLAVPLFSPTHDVIGSLGLAGPLFRFAPDSVHRLVALLQTEQQVVQQALHNISTV